MSGDARSGCAHSITGIGYQKTNEHSSAPYDVVGCSNQGVARRSVKPESKTGIQTVFGVFRTVENGEKRWRRTK